MKIAIDCLYIASDKNGFYRYTVNLLLAIKKHGNPKQFVLLCPENYKSRSNDRFNCFEQLYTPTQPPEIWAKNLSDNFPLEKFELLYIPHDSAPVTTIACSFIVTLHDTIPLLFLSKKLFRHPALAKTGSWTEYKKMKQKIRSSQRAAMVATVSHFSKKELIQAGIPDNKIGIISNTIDPVFSPQPEAAIVTAKNRFKITTPFLLFSGGQRYRKNCLRVIKAYLSLPSQLQQKFQLVVTGKIESAKTIRWLNKHHTHIKCTGPISDQQLATLYSAAHLLLFPSLYEGFGLPPLEAAACGTPSIISDNSALVETASPHSLEISPFSTNSIKKGITRLLGDKQLYKNLQNSCHPAHYSLAATYKQFSSLIEKAQ